MLQAVPQILQREISHFSFSAWIYSIIYLYLVCYAGEAHHITYSTVSTFYFGVQVQLIADVWTEQFLTYCKNMNNKSYLKLQRSYKQNVTIVIK